ncbi:hypothetical protein [Streptomyces sp. NPDC088350]|uniref:hypothetical protein n=1 Tax=Streptomyces sp. NPDC088350 TaxID=3365854 RepID=UPI0037F1F765
MGARPAPAVRIQHPGTREPIVLQPGEEPEPEVAGLITDPDAWEEGILPELPLPEEPDAARAPEPQAVTELAQEPSPATLDTPKPEPAPTPTAAPRTRTRTTAPE